MTALEDRRHIAEARVVSHGLTGHGEFPGHTSWTGGFEEGATGVGGSERLAYLDAREQLAEMGWDTLDIEDPGDILSDAVDAHADCECECKGYCTSICCNPDDDFDPSSHCTLAINCDCACHDECDLTYYVSVDVKGVES